MVNYQNGKIYKIQKIGDDSKIYIGSTTKLYLSQRFDTHRSDYRRYRAGKFNKVTSFDLFDAYGIENCEIVLLQTYPCNSKDELRAKEGDYTRMFLDKCVNRKIEGRTRRQYRQDNKNEISKYKKQYREENKEIISMQQLKQCICNCGISYTYTNKNRHQRSQTHVKTINLFNTVDNLFNTFINI
jgi:hypothetical protein